MNGELNMGRISRESLWTLEHYSRIRNQFRAEVMAHKKLRKIALGDHITLLFEDEKTIRYQIQEMLRIEKTFEEEGIRDELDAYNPLIPDGRNFKATMMIEYPDPEIRRIELRRLKGVESRVWVQVEGREKVWAIADEDLIRENEEKTSSVHFMRFELDEDMAAALKYGVSLSIGVDHPAYTVKIDPLAADVRTSLVKDLA
jgi:TusA-related sulfurtransferase